MTARSRTRLLDYLRLLWAQHQDESKDYHDAVLQRTRELEADGLAYSEAAASAAKGLRDQNPDRVRRTVSSDDGMTIVLSAPLKFALAWVAERLLIPADDSPLQNRELDMVIENLLGDQDSKYPVLERAITAIALPGALTADHGVVPALNRFDEDGRTVELIEEMQRLFPDEATKGNWPRPGAEAGDPTSDGTVAQERVSLPDLLCRLYAYHVRLENEFDAAVEKEIKWRALDGAIGSGDPVTMIEPRSRLPDKAVERYARIRDAAIRDAKFNPRVTAKRRRVNPMLRPEVDDKRVVLARAALYEPMRGLVRKRQDAAGRPVENSNAWKLAVRWVSQRLDDGFQDACSDRDCSAARGSGVSLVEFYLDLYCRLELVPRVQKDGQFKQLAFAHDPIRRMTLEGLEDALVARGYDIVGKHHKLWEKRQNDAGFCRLEKTITRLDEEGKGVELLRAVWQLHRTEALDVSLTPPPALPHVSHVGKDTPSIEKQRDRAFSKEGAALVAGERRWLDRIVDCAHEDARDDRRAERYRAMVRDWAEVMVRNARPGTIPAGEQLQRENPHWTKEEIAQEVRKFDLVLEDGTKLRGEDALDVLHDPLTITTHAGTPLNKKYATLAAIHDASKHCAFPIDPWNGQQFDWARMWTRWGDGSPGPESVPPEEYREAAMALKYAHLKCVAVAALTDDDRGGIERMLDEVAADLECHLAEKVAEPAPTPEPKQLAPARHSGDFRSVYWFGTDYSLTANQAAVVKLLWKAWENSTPQLSDAYLLTEAGADCKRLPDVFRDSKTGKYHAAWDSMIVAGATKGTRQLKPPKVSNTDANPT